jgi:hypothetical protein
VWKRPRQPDCAPRRADVHNNRHPAFVGCSTFSGS